MSGDDTDVADGRNSGGLDGDEMIGIVQEWKEEFAINVVSREQ